MTKPKWIIAPVLLGCFLFTGCINILEDLILNKDGSGKYAVTIDMSGMFSDPMMAGLMEGSEDNDKMKDMDSLVNLGSLPDSVISGNPDLWKRAYLQMYSNKEKKQFFFKVMLDFKNLEEIEYLSANLDKVMPSNSLGEAGGESSSKGLMMSEGLRYTFDKKTLSRISTPAENGVEKTEELEMMKTFFENATYKVTYQMPGPVKEVTIPNSTIEGNKVITNVSFLELAEKKVTLDGSIILK